MKVTEFDIISLIVGVLGLVVGVISLVLTIKTYKLTGSIKEAIKREKLSTNLSNRKKALNSLLNTLTKDMKEGNPEILNRAAISHFREVLIELERYIILFPEDDRNKIKTAHSLADELYKKEVYNINDCNDFEEYVLNIKSLINGVIL